MQGPTSNHAEIRLWAAATKAYPAEIIPHIFDSVPTVLCFTFGSVLKSEPEIRPISWESFFATFDLLELPLVSDHDSNYELLQGRPPPRSRFEGKVV